MLSPTLFPGSTLLAGPKHSTWITAVAVPISVEKEGPLLLNPVPGIDMKASLGPQLMGEERVGCTRAHSMLPLPFILQVVTPLLSPVTVQLKVKVSPRQVGRAAVSCPVTSPGEEKGNYPLTIMISLVLRHGNEAKL